MKRSELDKILQQHQLWLDNKQKQGARAYLQGADLQGADLRDANLWYADLRDADLEGTNLRNANLGGAFLQGASLQGADLQGADLRGAQLRYAHLQGATFDLNFKKVWLFYDATFSEDQAPWVVLHPKYPKWADTLKWVKGSAEAA